MPGDINRALFLRVIDEAAHVSKEVNTQFRAWSDFAAEDLFPYVPAGETPLTMPAHICFSTFVVTSKEAFEFGMEGAQAVCKS